MPGSIKRIGVTAKFPTLKRVAAYARISMETERLNHSLSAQISYYSDLIQKHTGWIYVGVFADHGQSGTNTDRPKFKQLMEECEAGHVDIVLTKSISRFARNTVDLLKTVRRLKELGIEIIFEKENISTKSEEGELMLSLLASFAQEESRSISENIKWRIRKGFENGQTRNTKIYGYRVVNGTLSIKEDEAAVVQRIFDMFLSGDSCYMIAQKLNREGTRSYAGKQFHGEVIACMLRQEKYMGCTMCQKLYTADHITHKQKKNDGRLPKYFIEGSHPAIISPETFQAAQEEYAQRYGTEIMNGIVQPASYLHRWSNGRHDPPRRKAQWSEEQRRRHSEFFSKRENVDNRYDLSRFIRCEGCGIQLCGQLRYYTDGTKEVCWICDDHNRIAPGAPRPIPLRDSLLKQQIATAMGLDSFDAEIMYKELTHISVNRDIVTLHYRNGPDRTFTYIQQRKKRAKNSNGNN